KVVATAGQVEPLIAPLAGSWDKLFKGQVRPLPAEQDDRPWHRCSKSPSARLEVLETANGKSICNLLLCCLTKRHRRAASCRRCRAVGSPGWLERLPA